jgi:LacI family transcriptional regulator
MKRVSRDSDSLHIALLLNREYVYGRKIMQGIMSYVRPSKRWKISIGRLTLRDVRKLVSLKPDGIIAEVFSPEVASVLNKSGIPYVDVSEIVCDLSAPSVCTDNVQIGKMAAAHLIERGYINFAYLGGNNCFARLRENGFAQTLTECGLTYSGFTKKLNLDFYGSNVLGETPRAFHEWLQALPKPVAVFACNDAFALIVNEACRQLDIHVPDKVAILGVDNDEQFCQLETPAISSVELPLWQIGTEAVSLLDQLVTGQSPAETQKRLSPVGIVLRQSSDIVAFLDETLAKAMRYIREHAGEPLTVEQACEALCVSRRLLEKSMKSQIGHSPLTEIHRVHIERAKMLLLNSNLSLPQIARTSGFRSPERMSVLFKRFTGTTPSRFRKYFLKK